MGKVYRSKEKSKARIQRKHGGDADAPTAKLVYPEGYYGASLRHIRIAPQKARLVVNLIRGQSVERAREILRYTQKRVAYYADRILLSALANADVKSEGQASPDDLIVAETYVDEGPRLKRFLAGPMGRARPILRRMCHITIVLGPKPEAGSKKGKKSKGKKEQAA